MARKSRKARRQKARSAPLSKTEPKTHPGFVADLQPEAVLERYNSFIFNIIHDIQRALPGTRSMTDDLLSEGQLGLLDAYKRFDPEQGCAFTSFAYYRIKGSILDGLRRSGFLKRRQATTLAINQTACRLGEARNTSRSTSDSHDFNNQLGRVDATIVNMGVAWLVIKEALYDKSRQRHQLHPEQLLLESEDKRALHLALKSLSEEDRTVITRVYFQGHSFADIARDFNCSRSWISRVHTRALRRLSEILELASDTTLPP